MSIGVGVIGTGWGVKTQVPAFRAAGLRVTAVWARTAEKAAAAAAELAVPCATADWEEVVGHPEVDLVSVTTPPHTHREMAAAALAAGRHVLCEKPTALDAAEAAEMLAAARRHPDRRALIDHELRFVPARRRLRRLVAEGWLGELHEVEAQLLNGGRLDPARPWTWWCDRDRGGGILGAAGSHLLDFVAWVTGRRVEAVRGTLGTFVRRRRDHDGVERPVTADQTASVELRLSGGAAGSLRLSTLVAGPPLSRLRLSGSAGTLVHENGVLRGARAGERELAELAVPEPRALPAGLRDDEWRRGTLELGRRLAAALDGGDRDALADAATFADGLRVQRLLDAVRRSHAGGGGWVEVPAARAAAPPGPAAGGTR